MKILDWGIANIALIDNGKFVLPEPPVGREAWEINTRYGYRRTNDANMIEEIITIDAFCWINGIDARVSVGTKFNLRVEKGNYDIVGEENYRLFATFTQIAIAHARVYFKKLFAAYEHGNNIMPAFPDEVLYERVKISEQQFLN